MTSSLLVLRAMLAAVFAVAAVTKIASPQQRAGLTRLTRTIFRIDGRLAAVATYALVLAEASASGLLIVTARVGLVIATAVVAALTAGLLIALARGADEPCQCFGVSSSAIAIPHVIRNVALLGAALAGLLLTSQDGTTLSAASTAVSVLAGVVLAVATILFDELVGVFGAKPPPQRAHDPSAS